MSIAEVKNLSFSYSGQTVLKDINFKISGGDFVALLGPNGSGKTTLIKILLGLLPSQKGKIILFDNALKKFNAWQNIGYLEQKTSTPRDMPLTAFGVVRLGLLSTKKGLKLFNKEDNKKTDAIMKKLHCYNYKDKLFSELSGGQQQRVLLARTLINEPKFLILDEPSTALDTSSREEFFEIISALNKENKTTILLVTHDISQVGKYVNKFLILDKQVIFYGSKEEFCDSAKVTAYFGPYTQHLMDHLHTAGTCPLPHNHGDNYGQNCSHNHREEML